MSRSRPLVDRFWDRVEKGDSCWLWRGAIHHTGYGVIAERVNGQYRQYRVHRLSYELHHGTVPDDLCVCHHCDVRHCVNPGHLFVGTAGDNQRDAARKGRVAERVRIASDARRRQLAENKGARAKFSEQRRRYMKERWQDPEYRKRYSEMMKGKWAEGAYRKRKARTT